MGILDYYYKMRNKERIYWYDHRVPQTTKIVTLLRIRNESLIIRDTLNHLSQFSDAIICLDDASTDNTLSIISTYPKVVGIIRNYHWAPNPEERILLETQHRKSLVQLGARLQPEWFFCADADERYFGDIRGFVNSEQSLDVDIVKIMLFDAYMTLEDQSPFKTGQTLEYFRQYFGPERRDIVMMWRSSSLGIEFQGSDSREPAYTKEKRVIKNFFCQHYGKALSLVHWEETCDYYINHFPFDSYGQKWLERKGKAVHTLSDFGRPLYHWGDDLFNNAVVIKS